MNEDKTIELYQGVERRKVPSKEAIEEYLFRAYQTGKADSSNMADHILKKMNSSLEVAMNKYINGKLDKMQKHLEDQDLIMVEIKDEQVRVKDELKNFKLDTQPIIDAKKALSVGGKAVLWVAGAIITIGAAILMIKSLWK